MLFLIKSALLRIFSIHIVAILLRYLFVTIIVLFVLPIIFPSINDKMVKICLIILAIILIEIIAFRVNEIITNKYANRDQFLSKNNQIEQQINELTPTINQKNLSLLLYSRDINVSHLIPKNIYAEIILPNLNNITPIKNIQLFNHYTKPLLAIEINDCETILSSLNNYPIIKKLLSIVKKNNAHEINIVISADTIFNSEDNKDDVFSMLRCAHALRNKMKRKFNINLIIDKMANLPGFTSLLQSSYNMHEKTNLFSFNFNINVGYKHDIFEKFEYNFSKFLFNLEKETLLMNFEGCDDMQKIHSFIQMLHYGRERLKTVLVNAANICDVHAIGKLNNINISIRFVQSQAYIQQMEILASKELQLCCQI